MDILSLNYVFRIHFLIIKILISGELDKNSDGFLALDDLTFSSECSIDFDVTLPTYELYTTDSNSISNTTALEIKPSSDSKNIIFHHKIYNP